MKALIALAGAATGVFAAQNTVRVEPDAHIGALQDCTLIVAESEFNTAQFNRIVCELARTIPYDSVECFLSAWHIGRAEEEAEEEDAIEEPDPEAEPTENGQLEDGQDVNAAETA